MTSSRLIAWLALGFVVASAQLRPAGAAETRALALTEVKGVELRAPPSFGTSSPVIRIAHFNEVLVRLRAAGLRVVEPRRSKPPEGCDFSELGFTDPDGHVVVLYQLD